MTTVIGFQWRMVIADEYGRANYPWCEITSPIYITREVAEEALELYRSKRILESNSFEIDSEISKFELIAIEAELYPTDTMTEVWY